jgi:GMP synthase (glutamine-hydrolysing)
VNSITQLHAHKLLILDFGSQYTQLIARRIRELGVYCEIYSSETSAKQIKQFAAKGIILSGGPETVTDVHSPRVDASVFQLGIPVLGICYGMQTMVEQLGGNVEQSTQREFGFAQIRAHGHSQLLTDLEDSNNAAGHGLLDVWMSHGDRVTELPTGFKLIASSEGAPIAGIANEAKQFYGLQFHPEVTHTKQGQAILARFVINICACDTLWTTDHIIEDSLASIRKKVGHEQVILGLSGGVDSSVVAALLHKALGQQLTCVFVDTGLLRLDEGNQVMAIFAQQLGVKVIRVNAEARYLHGLAGMTDPEQKRKIIGKLFIDIFEEEADKLISAKWLAQGTIYPDVIESAGTAGQAHLIKSHHNVGGLPKDMRLKLVEPLRELFKDEVRQLGLELGLPRSMVFRHPFPGPGLGVRILGEVKLEYADLLRQADAIFIEALHQHKLYDKVSQAFAVFLPIKSVGVMGDGRRYDYVIALRAVETIDFMTARWAHLPYDFLDLVSRRIINEVAGISRVTYDISGKPPATIEWE